MVREVTLFSGERDGAYSALIGAGVPIGITQDLLAMAHAYGVASYLQLVNGRYYGVYFKADTYRAVYTG